VSTRLASPVRLALALLATGAACHRAPVAATLSSNPHVAADSLQGVVRIVGDEAFPTTTLSFDDGSPALALDNASLLKNVAGSRVAIVGIRRGNRLVVDRFTVLSVHGVTAADGVLAIDDGTLILVQPNGARLRLMRPPPGLRALAGHRVWVSGEVDEAPVAYGVIK
jgi:hypothetical protein